MLGLLVMRERKSCDTAVTDFQTQQNCEEGDENNTSERRRRRRKY